MKMRKFLPAVLAALLAAPAVATSQAGTPDVQQNADKARAKLNAMVKALGGDLWLNIKNYMRRGQVAAFYHGNPDLGTTETFEYHAWPDDDRIEVTKHKDVDEMFIGREGWEVTYRGKRQLPKDQVDDFLRRRDHSIETAVKAWMKEPNTILIDEGQHLAENYLADQVTLISPQNDSITILMDAQTHLPLQTSFQWRDPLYHDKNTETEEYGDYHLIDGFETPFSITRLKNGEMVRQYYVTQIRYNLDLGPDFWNVDQVARKTKGK